MLLLALQYNWTYAQWPEILFFPKTANGTDVFVNSTRTLWEMGNVFVTAAKDVQYTAYSGDPTMINESTSWEYARQNGPGSITSGYHWSLDVMVDHAVMDLSTLASAILVMLVVEVRWNVGADATASVPCISKQGALLV